MKNHPHIQQHDEQDCGAACLSMITKYYGLNLPIAKFRELIKIDHMGANLYGLSEAAKSLGFLSESLEGSMDELWNGIHNKEFSLPFIARVINELGYAHYIVVWEICETSVKIGDPGKTKADHISPDDFLKMWQGQIVTISLTPNFQKGNYNKGAFSRYFKYVFQQKRMFAFVILMSIVITLITVMGAAAFQYVIQCVQSHLLANTEVTDSTIIYGKLGSAIGKLFPSLITMSVTLILFYLLKGLIVLIRDWTLVKTVKQVDLPITMGYYRHLMDLPLEFFNTRKTADFMKRFSDACEIRNAISSSILSLVLDTILAVSCGIFLFWLNGYMFYMALLLLLFYAAYILFFNSPMKIITHETMKQESQVLSYLKETIDGMETIKSYNYTSIAKNKAMDLYSNLLNLSIKRNMLESLQSVLTNTTEEIGTILILAIGCIMCNKNLLSLSELFIFYYMLNYFTEPIKSLVSLQPTMQAATAAAERINDITDAQIENDSQNPIASLKGDIVMDHVFFRYGNHHCTLNDLSLIIPQGSKVAIIGESGCGKTTISKLLMSFYSPERGSIFIGGNNMQQYSPSAYRSHISYVSQNTFLLADSIYENLRMGDERITNEEIVSMCKKCAANEFIENLPAGYETVLEENGLNLSGGQRQKLAIARALLRKPDILIMDEATSNLDSFSEQIIQNLVDELTRDVTVIIIAHRLSVIKNCDKIFFMQNGSILDSGTHETLMKTCDLYAKIWGSNDEYYQ